ncbi:non-structural maintenance of chromosomes element 4 homolog A [Frieseomelitta varia]|uniref:non-structural maintenance of chromosomes element 4 homolog A n=1 Tax=Frieseomelitta varia TaxID=561572 RepID=UPI001CB6A9C2|nr:non-structural maintenance of chromosomes element 4 homolog A [Frieseomelitta varia]
MSMNNSNSNSQSFARSPQQRKEILRKIITRAQSLQEAVNDDTINNLELCMKETDNINSETSLEEKMHNQDEVLMDSEMMNISSNVLKQCTRSLTKRVCSYNHIEFAQKLVQYINQLPDVESEIPDWSLLKLQVVKSFKRTSHYTTLLGTLVPLEKKEINRRKPTVRETQAQIKKPDNVVTVEKEEESAEQTVKINKIISKYYKTYHKPLDFFKLVLNPDDFGKTIQNILQISFLIRDGRVIVTKDESGVLVVQPCSKDKTTQAKAGKRPNIQNVMYLNMEQWKILRNTYRLKKPMIDCDTETL